MIDFAVQHQSVFHPQALVEVYVADLGKAPALGTQIAAGRQPVDLVICLQELNDGSDPVFHAARVASNEFDTEHDLPWEKILLRSAFVDASLLRKVKEVAEAQRVVIFASMDVAKAFALECFPQHRAVIAATDLTKRVGFSLSRTGCTPID